MSALSSDFSRLPPADQILFERIAVAIETSGYVVLPNALPEPIARDLANYLSELDPDAFHEAQIGRGGDQIRNQFVRRDKIHWIEDNHADARDWANWTARLRTFLNRRLFLGLFSFESHFAIYHPGDFYRTHLDAFRGESNRVLSLVTYLNRGWLPDQGGELVIYDTSNEAKIIRVIPAFGTLVLFLSEEFPHEVLAAQRDRYSVSGWFRLNGSIQNQIDPPS